MVLETGPETAMSLFEMAHDSFEVSSKKWPVDLSERKENLINENDFKKINASDENISLNLDINSDEMNKFNEKENEDSKIKVL